MTVGCHGSYCPRCGFEYFFLVFCLSKCRVFDLFSLSMPLYLSIQWADAWAAQRCAECAMGKQAMGISLFTFPLPFTAMQFSKIIYSCLKGY
jgi:hypothetical protein